MSDEANLKHLLLQEKQRILKEIEAIDIVLGYYNKKPGISERKVEISPSKFNDFPHDQYSYNKILFLIDKNNKPITTRGIRKMYLKATGKNIEFNLNMAVQYLKTKGLIMPDKEGVKQPKYKLNKNR